jgi:hypothetical protein
MRGLSLLCAVLCLCGCPKTEKAAASSREAAFWTWFAKEEVRLANEARAKDPRGAMMEISGHLEAIDPGAVGELAIQPDEMHPHTLVVSANGDTKAFPVVKKIVAAAPPLTKWKVVAFRQRREVGQSLQLDGFEAKQADFFFREAGRAGGKVNVEVLVKGMNDGNQKIVQQAAFLMLDHLVGEYDVETKLAGISVKPLPEPQGDDVKPLSQLAGVVDAL